MTGAMNDDYVDQLNAMPPLPFDGAQAFDAAFPLNTETLRSSSKKVLLQKLCDQQYGRCFWCGEVMNQDLTSPLHWTIDHIIPTAAKSKETTKLSNLKAACFECNQLRNTGNYKFLARRNTQYKTQLQAGDKKLIAQRKHIVKLEAGIRDLVAHREACLLCSVKAWWKRWKVRSGGPTRT